LDRGGLETHLAAVRERKEHLFSSAKITKEVLNSGAKFAALLESFGVDPPMKISPTSGKEVYAFAKTDEQFTRLAEHSDERVQTAVAARLGAKSTLEETRTERFLEIHGRGPICGALGRLPIPLKYYAAHTGRWGGLDKINLQNLPSRGDEGSKLKRCIVAPAGHVIIDCDSSQIEARVLAWLAGQNDLLELFKNGEDVYKFMASAIFKAPPEEIISEQRFIGKMVVLGCGYGMGAVKFQEQLRAKGVRVDSDRCSHIIRQYRLHNAAISRWWIHLNSVVDYMLQNKPVQVDARGVMETTPFTGIALPNGLFLNYPELRKEGAEFSYKTRAGRSKIYGGKIAENVCQAIARIIIGEQMLEINKKYRVVLTVHDAVACVVLEGEALEASTYIKTCMRTPPAWALGLPLNCELGVARTYGDC